MTSDSLPEKILVIQTAFLGDLLLTLPFLRELRRVKPHAEITLLCRAGITEIVERLNLVDVIVVYAKTKNSGVEAKKSMSGSWGQVVAQISSQVWDTVLCLHQSPRSHFLVSRLQATLKVGYDRFWNRIVFDEVVQRELAWPEVMRQMQMLAVISEDISGKLVDWAVDENAWLLENEEHLQTVLGESDRSVASVIRTRLAPVPEWASMEIPQLASLQQFHRRGDSSVIEQLPEKVRAGFRSASGKPILTIAPGSAWPTKRWPVNNFLGLVKHALEAGYCVWILGTSGESEGLREIVERRPDGVFDFTGRLSLWESAQALAISTHFVCNDSGSMHLGSLSGVKTTSLFGPTTIELGFRPWNQNAEVVQMQLDCRPCGKHGAKVCPISTHECLAHLPSDVVARVALVAEGSADS